MHIVALTVSFQDNIQLFHEKMLKKYKYLKQKKKDYINYEENYSRPNIFLVDVGCRGFVSLRRKDITKL